jgi:hypothetical protein
MTIAPTITGREAHPIVPLMSEPELSVLGPEKVEEYYKLRRDVITLMLTNPFAHGWEPEIWKKADEELAKLREKFPKGVITELDLGGNRASKTERRAKRLVQNMEKNPGWRAWALQSSQVSSRQNQQSVIYKYLPPEWKPSTGKLRIGPTAKIVYSQAGGFTEDTLVCPNGSQLWFKFYTMDVGSIEGAELDEAWADELVTPDWIEALIFRLVTRNGLLGITFTPIEGYTAAVKKYLAGAITIEEVEAELLPILDAAGKVTGHEKVPRVQYNDGERALITYFHTADNVFGNYESMKETLSGSSREKILMRAYGVPSKMSSAAFPKFKDTVHVITWARYLQILKEFPRGTRFHLIDPCSGRNWFMGWFYCWKPGHAIMYREWPSHSHTGLTTYIPGEGPMEPWAVAGNKEDGDKGPAQNSFGWGYARYKEEWERVEEGEEIFERWIDCRYANAAKTERETATTLLEQMEQDLDIELHAMTAEKNIIGAKDGSIDMINEALAYDEDPLIKLGDYSARLSRTNEPRLLIVDRCPNTIFAFQNWTGKDGQKGACKDPIDLVRGFYLSELGYIPPGALAPRDEWSKQFA